MNEQKLGKNLREISKIIQIEDYASRIILE